MKRLDHQERVAKSSIASAVLAIGLIAPAAPATTFNESPDAGNLIPSALPVPAGTTKIVGSLGASFEVDLFQFTFSEPTKASFAVTPTGEWFDDDMTLFDSVGHPIAVSDFAWSIDLPAGTFYFALTDWNAAATDSIGTIIADDYYGVLNTSGVLGGWDQTSTPWRFGPYEIAVTTVALPEPTGIVAIVTGMGALIARRRKKTSQSRA
jgi:hypothetical protein